MNHPTEDDLPSDSRDRAGADVAPSQTDTADDVSSLPLDDEPRFEYVHSASLPMLLGQYQAALVATSYQISRILVLSSTGVKELATFGGDVSDLVPAEVAAALAERIQR